MDIEKHNNYNKIIEIKINKSKKLIENKIKMKEIVNNIYNFSRIVNKQLDLQPDDFIIRSE